MDAPFAKASSVAGRFDGIAIGAAAAAAAGASGVTTVFCGDAGV